MCILKPCKLLVTCNLMISFWCVCVCVCVCVKAFLDAIYDVYCCMEFVM